MLCSIYSLFLLFFRIITAKL